MRDAQLAGSHFLELLQQGDFVAAEQHIAPAARAQYSAASLQQRWTTVSMHVGTVRQIQPKRGRIEIQGLSAWASLEYDIIGDRDVARVRIEAAPEGKTIEIHRMEFVF